MTILFLLMAGSLVLLAVGALADVNGNDDMANAEEALIAHYYPGVVSENDPVDWYKFEVVPGENILFYTGNDAVEALYYRFYDPAGTQVLMEQANAADGMVRWNWLTPWGGPAADWYVRIGDANYTQGNITYWFNITTTMDVDVENNDAMDAANNIIPINFSGSLVDTDTDDWFRFRAGEGDYIELALESDAATVEPMFAELSRGGSVLERLEASGGDTDVAFFYTDMSTSVDWFYLHLGRGADTGTYEMIVQLHSQDDARSGQDGNMHDGPNLDFELGVWEEGYLEDWDTGDWYEFLVPSGSMVKVWFKSAATVEQTLTIHYYIGREGVNGSIWETHNLTSKDEVVDTFEIMIDSTVRDEHWRLNAHLWDPPDDRYGAYWFRVSVGDQFDGGDSGDAAMTQTNATQIGTDDVYSGWAGSLDTTDTYKLPFDGGGWVINITFEEIQGEVYLSVHLDDDVIANTSSHEEHWWEISMLTAYETPAGMLYLVIYAPGDIRSYNFTVIMYPQDDAGSGQDAPTACADAVEITPGTYDGRYGFLDETDQYKFAVDELRRVTVTFESEPPRETWLHLLDGCDGAIVESMNGTGIITLETVVPAGWTAGDAYFFKVIPQEMDPHGVYHFTLGISAEPVDVEPPVVVPDPPVDNRETEDLVINATITDEDGNITVTLYYRMEGDTEWESVEMTETSAGEYMGTIPLADLRPGNLEWYIEAVDSMGNSKVTDEGTIPIIDVDQEPPVVVHTPPDPPKENQDLVINCTMTDEDDATVVTLYYRMEGETDYKTVVMTNDVGDNFVGTVPKADLSAGTLEYYIEATDGEGNTETVQSGSTPINLEVKKADKPDDGPGFGAGLALATIALLVLVVGRRRR